MNLKSFDSVFAVFFFGAKRKKRKKTKKSDNVENQCKCWQNGTERDFFFNSVE